MIYTYVVDKKKKDFSLRKKKNTVNNISKIKNNIKVNYICKN